jgi:N-acetyl sugar amidotransferase
MRWCKNCVEPDTRPGQVFNEDGICTPCQYALNIKPANWDEREKELKDIVAWAKQNAQGKYDCVLGVSGGKDSLRLALFAREIGLNPLLVCATYVPQQMTDLGAHNLSNIVEQGFDLETINVAPETCKQVTRHAFREFCSWTKATEYFLISSMPRLALTHGIPLACGGENPLVTVGSGCGSDNGDARSIASLNTLSGGDISPYLNAGFDEGDLFFYKMPTIEQMDQKGLKFIYLGYYIRDWDAYGNHALAVKHGMHVRTGDEADPSMTGCTHNFVSLDEDFIFVNQYMKYLKFGFGFTAQQASHDIRAGIISREQGVELVKRYDGVCADKYIEAFCNYIEISREEFDDICERFRNKDIWTKDSTGRWTLKNPIS